VREQTFLGAQCRNGPEAASNANAWKLNLNDPRIHQTLRPEGQTSTDCDLLAEVCQGIAERRAGNLDDTPKGQLQLQDQEDRG